MGTTIASGSGTVLTGSSFRLPRALSTSYIAPTPRPAPSDDEVDLNAYDGAQVLEGSGVVEPNVRMVMVNATNPDGTEVTIPTQVQLQRAGTCVTRRIQIANTGSEPATAVYAGGTIGGAASVPIPPGGTLNLSSVPVVIGAAVVEFAIVAPVI